jgi:hypothetical protein
MDVVPAIATTLTLTMIGMVRKTPPLKKRKAGAACPNTAAPAASPRAQVGAHTTGWSRTLPHVREPRSELALASLQRGAG